MLELLRAAGPLASLNVAVAVIGALLSLATIALSLKGSNAARVTSVLCLVLALVIVGVGFAGHSLAMVSIDSAMGNVPADLKLSLFREGTIEARANFRVALACVALPLLAGVLGVLVRRHALGLVFALAALAGVGALVVAVSRPLPSAEPQLATVPGLELPESQSSQPLRVSARLSLTSDGTWLDGVRSTSPAQAMESYAALEPGVASVPVLVDRRVRFAAFTEMLSAASARGLHSVQLVVQGPGGARNIVTVLDAPIDPGPNPMLLTLFISSESLQIGAVGNRLPPLPRDWPALQQQLVDIKATFPDHRFLRIGAVPETVVGDLVAALDVASQKDGRRLFSELVVGAFELPEVLPLWSPDEVKGQEGEPIRLRAGRPEVGDSSSIDRDALFRYVRARESALSACFSKHQKRTGTMDWSIELEAFVSPEGRATRVAPMDPLPRELDACIKHVVSQWSFPFKPATDVRVVLRFTL